MVLTTLAPRLTIWNVDTSEQLISVPGRALGQESENNLLVTNITDRVTIWDGTTGQQLARLPSYHGDYKEVWLSRDGQTAIAVVKDGPCWIWHWKTGRRIELVGHKESVTSSHLSPDGQTAVTGSADGFARLWNTRSGELVSEFMHDAHVAQTRFSPDGKRLLIITDINTAHVWDIQSKAKIATMSAPDARFDVGQMNQDGTRVVTYCEHRNTDVRVWDSTTGQLIGTLPDVPGDTQAEFRPGGNELVVASQTRGLILWDYQSDQRRAVTESPVSRATFSSDGERLAAATCLPREDPAGIPADRKMVHREAPAIFVWRTSTQELLQTVPLDGCTARSLTFSTDGGRVLATNFSHGATIFDSESGVVSALISGHAHPISHAEFSPDGTQVVTTSWDHTASLWDPQTGNRLHLLAGHEGAVLHAAFSGDTVATASADRTCRTWNRLTGNPMATLRNHTDQVWFVSFNPVGDRIITISRDQSLRLWTLTGRQLDQIQLTQGTFIAPSSNPRDRDC